ncbi:YciI family protein [Octadecabacter sp. 1_MG-2023]|uniref:YciI family protein n=1 Tax=unclassified Octadecabacter TaxID=196158 RepID=UPI001C09A328|nr:MULTISPECIES: YciI family protein [unclassified Octadecabacter]MBU2992345.1 YciI family protein [Octadecabacter sp. B2R22]MDO6734898.1 YciI family protein [Octadecabacter sp. 1_MG-2023]
MRVALITRDKAGALQIRLDNRDAHLAYIAETGVVEMAGPFLDADGSMCGSMIIMNVETIADAQTWAENDPYAKAGLFEKVRIEEWKKVIG